MKNGWPKLWEWEEDFLFILWGIRSISTWWRMEHSYGNLAYFKVGRPSSFSSVYISPVQIGQSINYAGDKLRKGGFFRRILCCERKNGCSLLVELLNSFSFLNWNIFDLQCCVNPRYNKVIQLYTYIHSFFSSFPSWFITGGWIEFLVLYSRTLLFTHSKCDSSHLLTSDSQSIPPLLATISLELLNSWLSLGRRCYDFLRRVSLIAQPAAQRPVTPDWTQYFLFRLRTLPTPVKLALVYIRVHVTLNYIPM